MDLRGVQDPIKKADEFAKSVGVDLLFVAIDLDGSDDGQLIFETLNSLGTPLLPSDLIKNLLFRRAIVKELNVDDLYARYWLEFERDSKYWRGEVGAGRRKKPRIDLYLQYYLSYKLGKEPVVSHLFRDYRDALDSGALGGVEEAMNDFSKHSALWKQFDEADSDAPGDLRQVLEKLDQTVPNALILGVYANVSETEERARMLKLIESYLIRRFLCCMTTKNYNKTCAEIIGKMHLREWSHAVLCELLNAHEGSSQEWPSDEALTDRTCTKAAYRDLRGVGIAYVLSRLERSLRSGKSELTWNSGTSLTIEHLMPQKWETAWPLNTDDAAILGRKEVINRFGNLTILTERLNSAVSNGPWESKRRHLNDHTVLLVNSALAALPSWGEQQIAERSGELAEFFCREWSRGCA